MTVNTGVSALGLASRLRTRWALAVTMAGLIGLALPTPLAVGAPSVLYVNRASSACTNSGEGSAGRPFCAINAAAARVVAGQVVRVAAGTYPEDVHVRRSGRSTGRVVFLAGTPGAVTVRGKTNGFTLANVSWVTIKGFIVRDTTGYGISVSGGAHVTLAGNRVGRSGATAAGFTAAGIHLSGVGGSLVVDNVSHDNSDYGISVVGGSSRVEVRHNRTYGNARGFERAAAGIHVAQSNDTIVDRNISYGNEDSGIECYPGANRTWMYDNLAYANGDHGIDNLGATGQRIVANTVYGNVTAGINVEGMSTGATIANNISVENGINSPRTSGNIRVDSSSIAGSAMDYDLVHVSDDDATLMTWNSVGYRSLHAFQAATRSEQHGVDASPLWRDRAHGDFHLRSGSRAIDSANSAANGAPARDLEGTARIDDPKTTNQGAGRRRYDDRGAFEFVR